MGDELPITIYTNEYHRNEKPGYRRILYTIVMRKVLEFIQIEISTNYRANYAASNNQLCIRLSFLSLFPLKHILRESE
jgi:hypothetical protein